MCSCLTALGNTCYNHARFEAFHLRNESSRFSNREEYDPALPPGQVQLGPALVVASRSVVCRSPLSMIRGKHPNAKRAMQILGPLLR